MPTLTKASETTSDSQIHDVLCGSSFHTSTTESFFPETTYSSAAFDTDGKLIVSKFPSYTANALGTGTDSWRCSPMLCCVPPKPDLNQHITAIYSCIAQLDLLEARHFMQHIDDCTQDYLHDANLLGYHKICHTDPLACGSKLLYLRHLAPHYPYLKRIVKTLYSIQQIDKKLSALDCALTKGNVSDLEEIVKEHRQNKTYLLFVMMLLMKAR